MLPIEITVDGGGSNPASNQSVYSNSALAGLEYFVSQAGFGVLPTSAYQINPAGGFQLLNDVKFQHDETYFAHLTGLAYVSSNTDYTNGYHFEKVMAALVGRLAWRQSTAVEYAILNSQNQLSASGRYFNDFHPLVTIQNLKSTIENNSISNADFNQTLIDMQKSAIMTCLAGVFNKPELLEQTQLFERGWNNDQLVTNGGNFVGIRFRIAPTNIAARINSISVFFNAAKTFNLFLYHDTKASAIWQQSVTTVANDMTIVIPSAPLFLNTLINTYRGGYFYLGYYQDEIVDAKAYDEQYCTRVVGKHFGFDFFTSKKSGADFDRKNVPLTTITYGLNAEFTIFRDHTNSIIRNAYLFDDVIGNQMAYQCLKAMVYTVRSNANERILKDQFTQYGLQQELEGTVAISNAPQTKGLKDKIAQALKSIQQSFFPDPKPQVVSLC
jgi:hypothetical protein